MAKPVKQRSKRPNRVLRRIGQFFGVVTLLILLAATTAVVYAALLFKETQKTVQSLDSLVDYQPGGITEIFATDKNPKTGKPILLGQVYGKYREYLPVDKMPDRAKDATIAIEDERFYEHSGVDLWAVGRAIYKNFINRRMSEGASTLTQQLTRNLILNDKRKTVSRKLQEIMLSVEIEKNFSKEQILEMYLNEVYYGSRAYGFQAAARVYFNKPADKLSLAETALLAGLPQRPIAFDPFHHLDAAVRRRNTVLAKMSELKLATPQDVKAAQAEKPKLAPEPDPERTHFKAPYFTNYVLRQMIAKYGADRVYNNGFKVYTTLNYAMQQAAQNAVMDGIKRGKYQGITESALISLEPKTGYIRAMVGGVDYDKEEFNNVTQGRRQPGSTFKPIVYTAAFETGKFDPDYSVSNERVTIRGYSPRNYDGVYGGEVSIRTAVEKSINIPAVRVAYATGINKVVDAARQLGITSPLSPDLALALGASAISPLEMAGAYAVFANGGDYAHPMSIVRVVDAEGNTVENNAPVVNKSVIPESVAADISSMLRSVVTDGTGKVVGGVPNAHGKTGTTSERRDIWFAGYTPELATIVWSCGVKKVRRKDKKTGKTQTFAVYPSLDEGSFGGTYCGPIWAQFMMVAVPIQQQFAATGRVPAEQMIPTDGQVKIKTGITDGPASPHAAATPEALEIPRAQSDRREKSRRNADTESDTAEKGSENPAPEPSADNPSDTENAPRRRSDPTPEPAAEEKKVTVQLCSDSGKLATRWCPETVTRTIALSLVPKTHCTTHKPRPGDG